MKPILTVPASTGASKAASGLAPEAMTRLLTHHLSSFQANDLDALMSDYTDESMLMTVDATYEGMTEIRGFFAAMIAQFPTESTRLELDKMTVVDDLLFIVWHASTPTVKVALGTDTLLIRQGKIHRQTFAGHMEQVSPGGPGG
jgi:hypothetical protein